MNETTKPEQVKDETPATAEPQGGPGTPGDGQQEKPAKHKQVPIQWKDKKKVDEKLADFILTLWGHGIDTLDSCQECEPGMARIEFDSVEDAFTLLNRVTGSFPAHRDLSSLENLYCRITGSGSDHDWLYWVHPSDLTEENSDGPGDFDFYVSVYIPCDDIPVVQAILTSHHRFPRELLTQITEKGA